MKSQQIEIHFGSEVRDVIRHRAGLVAEVVTAQLLDQHRLEL
jgi:hypothetical protein